MLQIPTRPTTNVNDANAAAAATTNVSTITMFPGGMPVAVNGLKSIRKMILNVVAGNHGGIGVAQKAANANTQKVLGRPSQLTPLVTAQKATNTNNQKGLGHFSQCNPHVELRLRPACSTCRA
jgi:hypothetical protein